MTRDDRKAILLGILAATFIVLAGAAYAHTPDCKTIRALVKQHGRIAAISWARENGYSWADIWKVRKVCGV